MQGIATVAAIDCDAEANKQLCGRYEIRGFPTIKVFPGDKSKGGNKTPTDYQGSAYCIGWSFALITRCEEATGASDGWRFPCNHLRQNTSSMQGHGLPKA